MDQLCFDPAAYYPSPQQLKQAAALAELLRCCYEANVQVSLIGGYGLDALYGRLTRDHHDFDFLVEAGSRDTFVNMLMDLGYENDPAQTELHRRKEGYVNRMPEADYEAQFIALDSAGLGYYAKRFGFQPDMALFFPGEPNGELLGQPIYAPILAGFEIIDEIQAQTALEHSWGVYKHQRHRALLMDALRHRG